jgi:hypothetical protein
VHLHCANLRHGLGKHPTRDPMLDMVANYLCLQRVSGGPFWKRVAPEIVASTSLM